MDTKYAAVAILTVTAILVMLMFVRVETATADEFKTTGFGMLTVGYYTLNELGFGGLTGYLGVTRGNRGVGVMGSYEGTNTTFEGYDVEFEFANFYLSASLKLGRSTLMVSQGVSTAKGSLEEFEVSRSGYVSAITFIRQAGMFKFMGQARLQGRGIMLTAGVGF